MTNSFQELKKVINNCDASILYEPLETKDEIDYSLPSFPIKLRHLQIVLPKCSDSDPFSWTDECKEKFKNHHPFILIPGRKFDKFGERVGNGGGWYDRFLSKVPREWPRIGVCRAEQFSFEHIKQNPWDEPMDFVLVLGENERWEAYRAEVIP